MSPSAKHEELNRMIAFIVGVLAAEWDIDIRDFGSTTFRREDLERGFEPDSCFYIQTVDRIRGQTQLDLANDPPPDLIVEIDLSRSSLNKFPIYAQVGVPEIWRYDGTDLRIFILENDTYAELDVSQALPGLSTQAINQFMTDHPSMRRPEWLRSIRDWAQSHLENHE